MHDETASSPLKKPEVIEDENGKQCFARKTGSISIQSNCFFRFLSVDEDEIDEDGAQDTDAEPVSLASMFSLNAGDDYYGYDEAY